VGEAVVVKTCREGTTIGDFTLLFKAGTGLQNRETMETYADMAGMLLERIDKERQLLQEKSSRDVLLDNIHTQVWYLTDEHTYGAVNKAHADFNGMAPEDMAFKDMYDIFSRDIVEVCRQGNRDVFSKKQPIVSEEWVHHASGNRRLISIVKTPKLDKKGRVEYVVCSAEDITEQRRFSERLRENEQRLNMLLSNTPAVIFPTKCSATR
jgi:PAS domain S-box-containing protein